MNNSRIRLKCKGSYLKEEERAPFNPNKVVNLFMFYELDIDTWSRD